MSQVDISERYDAFQSDAVRAIVQDFKKEPKGRFLLVIPTGGGKTFTAVKSICEMFGQGVLDPEVDRVFWTAHRTELIDQAQKTFEKVLNDGDFPIELDTHIVIDMISAVPKVLKSDKAIRLVVVDEAHHGAANSYQPIFSNRNAGVLGLTATPSRHDGMPLEFDKESYSIGFPDLVKKGIILHPNIHKIEGGRYEFDDFKDEDLEQLNNQTRNDRIIRAIQDNQEQFHKIIIYVGTKQHAVDLYRELTKTNLTEYYESISYITGDGNSREQDRSDFIATEKTFNRSILVNVQILSEGYDDPKVNTIVMAAPSRSKLYYMQALGRAIRQDPDNILKDAHVVEVDDELPNIRYRIDNRWLYADISDALEPAVHDVEFADGDEFRRQLESIYENHNVLGVYRAYPEWDENIRYTLLLFKQYAGATAPHYHFPILIHNENRLQVGNVFNFLSERMTKFVDQKYNFNQVFRMIAKFGSDVAPSKEEKRYIFDAMSNACRSMQKDHGDMPHIEAGTPWMTFVALNYRRRDDALPSELLIFIEEMVNREEIHEMLLNKNYQKEEYLLRLPLPLGFYIGVVVTEAAHLRIRETIDDLRIIKESGNLDHRVQVRELLEGTVLPVEMKYSDSLVLIAREAIDYVYPLID